MVHVDTSREAGITRVGVRGFRPADAQRLAEALLVIGERRAERVQQAASANRSRAAREVLQAAEAGVNDTQAALGGLRQSARDIDPERTGAARIAMVTQMQGDLAQARARSPAWPPRCDPTARNMSPRRHRSEHSSNRSALPRPALPVRVHGRPQTGWDDLEGIRFRQELAAKRYEAATAALDTAREQALRQQLYPVRIVEPDLPAKALSTPSASSWSPPSSSPCC